MAVRTKEGRKKLVGFTCDDCEGYYKHLNLPTEELKKMIQECSKHRAIIAPPKNSPKEMWKIDMSPDKEVPIIREELLTRKKRRERISAGGINGAGGAVASLDFGQIRGETCSIKEPRITASTQRMSDLPPLLKKKAKDENSVKPIGIIKRSKVCQPTFINPKCSKF